jgi:hypothetical protein
VANRRLHVVPLHNVYPNLSELLRMYGNRPWSIVSIFLCLPRPRTTTANLTRSIFAFQICALFIMRGDVFPKEARSHARYRRLWGQCSGGCLPDYFE